MADPLGQRPQFRNIHITQILSYRLPVAGVLSILHRVSGVILFVMLPFIIWMFDNSLSSEVTYGKFTSVFEAGVGFLPGFVIKIVALGLIWAYLHHFFAGVRHLWMDATHSVSKEFGRSSAIFCFVASLLLTAGLGLKLFI